MMNIKLILIALCISLMLLSGCDSRGVYCFGFGCCNNPCDCGLQSDSYVHSIYYYDNGTVEIETSIIPCEEEFAKKNWFQRTFWRFLR